jgi:hypothetical protein
MMDIGVNERTVSIKRVITGADLEKALPVATRREAEHLLAHIRDVALPRPTGWHVLVLQYIRPGKIGSIILADKSRDEDMYQGRVGLVLAIGPECWADASKYPSGPWAKVGDWVMWPAMGATASRFKYGDAVLTLIADDRIMAAGLDPLRATGA